MFGNLIPSSVRESSYRRRFMENRQDNLFMGSFGDFGAAAASAPARAAIDFSEATAPLHIPQVQFSDYPSVFWLGRALSEGMRSVLEVGGNVGARYYAFRRMLSYPLDLRWTISESKEMVARGRELAAQRQVGDQLAFVADDQPLSDAHEVVYVSGSLRRTSRSGSPTSSRPCPRCRSASILNMIPVHPERTLYTLNSSDAGISPCRIQHHDELLTELLAAGYETPRRMAPHWRQHPDSLRPRRRATVLRGLLLRSLQLADRPLQHVHGLAAETLLEVLRGPGPHGRPCKARPPTRRSLPSAPCSLTRASSSPKMNPALPTRFNMCCGPTGSCRSGARRRRRPLRSSRPSRRHLRSSTSDCPT